MRSDNPEAVIFSEEFLAEQRAKSEARKTELAAENARRVAREAERQVAREAREKARLDGAKAEAERVRPAAEAKVAKVADKTEAKQVPWFESGRAEAIKKISSVYDSDGITDGAHVADRINKLLVDVSYVDEKTMQAELQELGLTLAYDSATDEESQAEYATNGFRGQIYKDKKGNLYSVIRGTDLATAPLSNLTTDVNIAVRGSFDASYKNMLHKFAGKLDEMSVADGTPAKPTVSVHGHSLGGGAANYIGALLALSRPTKEGVERQVRVVASDPVAVPGDINKLIAAKKELAANDKPTPSLQELATATSSPEIEAQIVRHLGGTSELQSRARGMFYLKELTESGARLFNLPFAVSYQTGTKDEYLQLSPVGVINEHFGEIVLIITETPPKATSTLHLSGDGRVAAAADWAAEHLSRGSVHGFAVVHSPEVLGSFSRAVFLNSDGNPSLARSLVACVFGGNRLRPSDLGAIVQPQSVRGFDTELGAVIEFSPTAKPPHVAIEMGDVARVARSQEAVKAVAGLKGKVGVATSTTSASTPAPNTSHKPEGLAL